MKRQQVPIHASTYPRVSATGKKVSEVFALREINFTQYKGQKIGIAGATGSGKSTLLKIISGSKGKHIFLRPEHFTISKEKKYGVKAAIKKLAFRGNYLEATVLVADQKLIIYTDNNLLKEGDQVYINIINQGHF